ncbi:lytic transglycosylase catalytic [Oryzomicrobium terrae]|uniref:Lytic transglycosylase catalytic n=1 Tax=Oryzomicrobium terrae TaxID=1735038 RepID=A0A5C1E568_9RHOO|nr:lytic transglycosylase domain-containing protein [Oryzomicrobium terrae]QEL64023.1 lytic transglycosylase catalytic [Oryzomicrobium terrae]
MPARKANRDAGFQRSHRKLRALLGFPGIALALAAFGSAPAWAGAQKYEPLSASVQAALSKSVADARPPTSSFRSYREAADWLEAMSQRLARRIPDREYRLDLLRSVHYEATRAGLDPQLVLGLMQVESGFRKYAVSSAGARGYMQVMPFWVKLLGRPDDNLFEMRTNLRYGCTILRHYLDIENGDLYRALGRYNGSLGKPEYPNLVRASWHGHWDYAPPPPRPSPPANAPANPAAPVAPATPTLHPVPPGTPGRQAQSQSPAPLARNP